MKNLCTSELLIRGGVTCAAISLVREVSLNLVELPNQPDGIVPECTFTRIALFLPILNGGPWELMKKYEEFVGNVAA
jgi:hypothetical protein